MRCADYIGAMQLSSFLEQLPTQHEHAARVDALVYQVEKRQTKLGLPGFGDEALTQMFGFYDDDLFQGYLSKALLPASISFGFSGRLRSSGGRTIKRMTRGQTAFHIEVASNLVRNSFDHQAEVQLSGHLCPTPLHAVARIMEHEIVHLIELLLFDDSSCKKKRFKSIAAQCFGHTEFTHGLTLARDIARDQGVVPGMAVSFEFEGETMRGVINRVNKRATVLVQSKQGQRYSDGKHYQKYYVPIAALKVI